MSATFYQRLITRFSYPPQRKKRTVFLCRHLPRFIAAGYLITAGYLAMTRDGRFWRFTFCPAITFLFATLLRHWLNFPRPYEVYPITPLIPTTKIGHSFPSRHTVSACIIALAFGYLRLSLGIVFSVAALAVAFSRLVVGVHFVRDILAAIALALFAGLAGFLL